MIASVSDLRTAQQSEQKISIQKASSALTRRNGKLLDLWNIGTLPAAGSVPATLTGVALTSSSPGAAAIRSASTGNSLYLNSYIASANISAVDFSSSSVLPASENLLIHVFDRVWHNGGIAASDTTRKSWVSPTLSRFANGKGLSLWFWQQTSGSGSSTSNYTLEYTNQNGLASTVVVQLRHGTDGISSPGDIFPLGLLAADSGIRSLNASTNSVGMPSGSYGFIIAKYYGFFVATPTSIYQAASSFFRSLPAVENDACITFALQATPQGTNALTNQTYRLSLDLSIIEG